MNLIAAVGLVLVVGAPVRADDEAKKALEAFQGEWKIIEYVKEEHSDTKEELKNAKIVFAGSKMTIHNRGDNGAEEMTFALDPKATPTSFDITLMPKDSKPVLIKGIYKLEKDKLTICFAFEGKPRPKEFKSGKGSETGMFVLERVKK